MDKITKVIIDNKLFEHVSETEIVEKEIERLQKQFKELKDKSDYKTAVTITRELMILKDKMIFHKACASVLQDVLDEVDKCKN